MWYLVAVWLPSGCRLVAVWLVSGGVRGRLRAGAVPGTVTAIPRTALAMRRIVLESVSFPRVSKVYG